MTDKELLERAAKAAGIDHIERYSSDEGLLVGDSGMECEIWNPLTDDGDALRLAVKLGFLIEVNYGEANQKVIVWDYTDEERRTYEYWEDTTGATCADPYAATRRAIVRAAAEIGKEMK